MPAPHPAGRAAADADAVVIGSGHNGLVAANLLADAGWSVLVLEAQEHAGGAVRDAEVTAPGFSSDLYSAFYPMGAGSPVIRELGLERYGLTWRHAPRVLAHAFDDGRAAVLSRDVDETAASLDGFAPGDGDAWRAVCAQWQRIGEPLLESLLRPFPPVRGATRLARALGVQEGLRTARFAVTPVRRYADEQFAGEGGKVLLTGNALHTDLSPDGAGSALFGWLLAMLGQHVGWPVPEGGSGRLVDAMVARLTARGGVVRTGAEVERVVVREGRAVGVRLRGGEQVLARRAVLADVAAPVLLRSLVGEEHLPARVVDDLTRFQWDSAVVKIDWALSERIPWRNPEVAGAGTVHLGVDLHGFTDHSAALAKSQAPQRPFLLFGQMTTTDPTRSPAGTESAWGYTHLPHDRPVGQDEVDRQVQRMEEAVERVAPGFRDLVVGRHVQGPATLQSNDANLVGGAVNGGSAQLQQLLVFRPVPGLARPETPVEGLYLASASAHPSGGVHGACGANAASAALARSRWYGPAYGAAWRAAHRAVWGPTPGG